MNFPEAVGVPEMSPVLLMESPAGNPVAVTGLVTAISEPLLLFLLKGEACTDTGLQTSPDVKSFTQKAGGQVPLVGGGISLMVVAGNPYSRPAMLSL